MEDKIGKYIGQKRILTLEELKEETFGGQKLYKIQYLDGSEEQFSVLMLDKVCTEKAVDLSQLRDMRITPVVAVVLHVLRDWGIKMAELSYFSTVLNQSLAYNHQEALNLLLGEWMPAPKDPEEVDLVTIDRILRVKKTPNEPKE